MYRVIRSNYLTRSFYRGFCKSAETELLKQLQGHFKVKGPISVSEYMKEVLTNPIAGYYMHKDVFGSKGDFTTSPEISQMFGELVGIWCVNEWMMSGSPPNLQIVELGPGRGTLADDMLRVFSKFAAIKDTVSLHLVEVSPMLSEMQHSKLCIKNTNINTGVSEKNSDNQNRDTNNPHYKHGISKCGSEVFWYNHLDQVPKGMTFYVAHEFFDALPIHKFQKQDGKWREVLVDIDDSENGPHHLRYVLANGETPASKVLLNIQKDDERDHIEISPAGGVIVEEIAARIAEHGGFSLIADYGHSGEKSDTFRGFKDHQLHDPLCEPGLADLTADVDFSYFRRIVQNHNVSHYGPITQEKFLHYMGIGARMQVLMGNATDEDRNNLITAYDMLTNPKKMGDRFKFFAITQKKPKDYIPAGFHPIHQ